MSDDYVSIKIDAALDAWHKHPEQPLTIFMMVDALETAKNDRETTHETIREYMDEFYQADMDGDRLSWPDTLEEIVGWSPPEDED